MLDTRVWIRKPCLVTGGSDKNIFFWDYRSKKRISQISSLPSSVSSLAFSYDGSYLAIASSYLYENGHMEWVIGLIVICRGGNNSIFVKQIEAKDISKIWYFCKKHEYISLLTCAFSWQYLNASKNTRHWDMSLFLESKTTTKQTISRQWLKSSRWTAHGS